LSTAPETGRTTPRSRNGTLDAQIAGADIEPVAAPAPSSTFKSPMSSFGHRLGRLDLDDLNFDRRGYNRWRTYFQSKLANMLFTAEKHRRLTVASSGTKALAAHPGATATDLGHEVWRVDEQGDQAGGTIHAVGRVGSAPVCSGGHRPRCRKRRVLRSALDVPWGVTHRDPERSGSQRRRRSGLGGTL